MARGKAHSDEVRAAVMAALLAGQSVSEIAAECQIPKQVVSDWGKSISDEQFGQVRTKKALDFGILLGDYLEKLLLCLTAQAAVLSEPDYIRAQPAAEMATLHGVMADKAIRILEAASRANHASGNSP